MERGHRADMSAYITKQDAPNTPEENSGEIELDAHDLQEVSEKELAPTVLQDTVAGLEGERTQTKESGKEQQPQTPEERAAKERHDIEDLIFEFELLRGKDISQIERHLVLRDGIDFSTVKRFLGSPDAARKLPQKKREELVIKIQELSLAKFWRDPNLTHIINMRVPEIPVGAKEYTIKLRAEIRKQKFKSLEPFFDKLNQDRYALEEFFDVQVSLE